MAQFWRGVVAWWKDQLAIAPLPMEASYREAYDQTAGAGDASLDYAIAQASATYQEVNNSRATVEGKATNLLGFVGVLAGIVAGGMSFSANALSRLPRPVPQILAASFVVAFLALAVAIAQLSRALAVGRHMRSMIVSVNTPLDLLPMSENERRRDILASLVTASRTNNEVNNAKASYLSSAQLFVMIALAILVMLGLFGAWLILIP